jgi:ATP-binding cassette subfamily B protein
MGFEYKVTGKAFDLSLIKRILGLLSNRKWYLLLGLVLTIASSIIGPQVPKLVQQALDKYVMTSKIDGLFNQSMLIAAVMILNFLVVYRQNLLLNWLGQEAIYNLRRKIFNHIIHLKLSIYDRTAVGTMITRTVSDVEAVSDVFSEGLISIVGDILQMSVILFLMISIDLRLTLVSLSVLPILIFAAYLFKESVKKAFQDVRTQIAKLNAFIQEHISGMSIVQAFSREEQEFNQFTQINARHRDANIKSIFAYSLFFPVIEVLSAVSIALIIWDGGQRILGGHITFGMVVAFTLYINLLFRPIRQIADKFNTLQMGIVSGDRIFQVLDMDDFIADEGKIITPIVGKVEFRNVEFAYQPPNTILKDLSFNLQEGKTLAIVGHTGAGKSSIISLLNRLYPYQGGQILVDGIKIEDYSLEHLRKNIAVVLQDVFLFSDSVYNNITLWHTNITKEDVMQAIRLVGAEQFINKLPGGLDYIVQERGASLSTGQRQLISFIRALVHNPKILILDEATSSVDNETEELLQKAIAVLLKGRTSIVIAHRLSTIRHASDIIVLDKGQIKEQGTHEQLIELGGLYNKLYRLQFDSVVG